MSDIELIEQELGINPELAPLEAIHDPLLTDKQLQLYIKREDRLHPIISGNKWRKLKYNLQHFFSTRQEHIISMGGAYSNHLHALAYIGHKLHIKTTGLIRGEAPENESHTLQDLRQWGMQLEFVDRQTFRKLREYRDYDAEPAKNYNGYWIPEGGANPFALQGVGEILDNVNIDFDYLTLACGTGTTLAGLAKALPKDKKVLGIAALKGEDFLEDEVKRLLPKNFDNKNWKINFDYHFGGFAKTNSELKTFIYDFQKSSSIPLEPIYNGKMFFGLFDLIQKDYFEKGETIIATHTGGLQGNHK